MMPRTDDAEEAVRRYLTKVGRRYLPAVLFFTAIALIIAYVPTKAATSTTIGGSAGAAQGRGVAGGTNAGSASAGTSGAVGASDAASTSGVPQAGSGGSGGIAGNGSGTPSGAALGGKPGVTVSGVQCGPGVRQVTWSKYAPECVPAWHGDNRGTTSPGVTATTITLAYRETGAAEQAAIDQAEPGAVPSNAETISDLQTYLGLFNQSFELYGRKVVLKVFQGQGDWFSEDEGQNLQGAQADAATEQRMPAFGDITGEIFTSIPFVQYLAQDHVVSFDNSGAAASFYKQFAPYVYNTVPTADQYGMWAGNLACARLTGMPAVFAGDSVYQHTKRVFGLVVNDSPITVAAGDALERTMRSACGATLARRVNYDFNLATENQQTPSIIAQMHAAGVTTLFCWQCDPAMQQALTQQADLQTYNPEWVMNQAGPVDARNNSQTQMAHSLSLDDMFSESGVPTQQSEAYQAFKLGSHGGTPADLAYPSIYYNLMHVFDAIQGAGPNLTPATLQQAMLSIPPSLPGGGDGTWRAGAGAFTPRVDSPVTRWDPNSTSYYDGKKGAYVFCDGGALYGFEDQASWGSRRQVTCP
ncbi:MAG: hypothetical protein JWO37_3768 [Acidimicrobiales bacterium]|jgi:hypothetical protein|nr:hypothetical protein [Acidimicrobiales bacterium]